jgi:hypothetical protein
MQAVMEIRDLDAREIDQVAGGAAPLGGIAAGVGGLLGGIGATAAAASDGEITGSEVAGIGVAVVTGAGAGIRAGASVLTAWRTLNN